jgi:hypothetical protein
VEIVWVESLGGPLVVVPEAALTDWVGGTETDDEDDYDRACAVETVAGVIPVGSAAAIVLGLPGPTCWLPERSAFLHWLAADSDEEIVRAADSVLADPGTEWEDAGTWETAGPALLMDSALSGTEIIDTSELGFPADMPPLSAPVSVDAGRWSVQACLAEGDETAFMLVRLSPA